jgi:hypothetical protein
VRERADLLTIDQTASAAFTVPYSLFDPDRGRWKFEPLELTQRFDNLMVQIRDGTN